MTANVAITVFTPDLLLSFLIFASNICEEKNCANPFFRRPADIKPFVHDLVT